MNTDNLKKEIKKVKVWHVAVLCAGIFLAFAIIGSILIAAGGGWNNGNWFNVHIGDYRNEGSGTVNDVNDHQELDMAGVNSVVITTVSEDVTLQAGGGKAAADLKGRYRGGDKTVWLETKVQGGTAYIEVKHASTIGFNFSDLSLSVAIPADFKGNLSVVTVSGDVRAEGLPFALGNVKMNTTSGDVDFATASYAGLNAGTVSGNVTVSGILSDTTVNTTSGQVRLDYADFASTTVVTVSGDVTAKIPQDAALAVDFDSVSGGFHSNHQGLSVGSADHSFKSSADGKKMIKVNTVSGDFEIEGK